MRTDLAGVYQMSLLVVPCNTRIETLSSEHHLGKLWVLRKVLLKVLRPVS